MNPDRVKFYTELMRSLTAFILGTGAGIFALIVNGSNRYFLTFVSIICVLSVGVFIALVTFLDKNSWIMSFEDVIGIILSIVAFIGFGIMFVIILIRAIGPKESVSRKSKRGRRRRFIVEEID